ncbi:hypothetical protein [Streptomyces sp. C1-2]|uniref:hypothetical protein n=1 Tax=Streptomyces sp. C1-2 TaxID=2720022 RepID=UPI0014324487|nr:hypothetical protein [Streptomyces sp. C1-2]NJP74434.1 hypothetical protein [Streptomyces sp. C1-2]
MTVNRQSRPHPEAATLKKLTVVAHGACQRTAAAGNVPLSDGCASQGESMRLPECTALAPLTTAEWGAIRSLHHACNLLRAEWQTAGTLVDRLTTLQETVEQFDQGTPPFQHHQEAVDVARHSAYMYERELGLNAWRYASAHAVLGITILDRLVVGRPALTAAAVDELCHEPTLGQLREALSIPAGHLLVARREESRQRADEDRQHLLRALGSISVSIRVLKENKPMSEQEAAACLLSENSPLGTDPMYDGVLAPLFDLAEQTPFEINWFLKYDVTLR